MISPEGSLITQSGRAKGSDLEFDRCQLAFFGREPDLPQGWLYGGRKLQ